MLYVIKFIVAIPSILFRTIRGLLITALVGMGVIALYSYQPVNEVVSPYVGAVAEKTAPAREKMDELAVDYGFKTPPPAPPSTGVLVAEVLKNGVIALGGGIKNATLYIVGKGASIIVPVAIASGIVSLIVWRLSK